MRLTRDDRALCASANGRPLFTYVFRPDMPREHSPRPYFHPVATLSGVALTDVRPADHPWHYGLSLAVPQVDGVNFWGGGTYVDGQGYVDRADHGRVVHVSWESDGKERLDWLTPGDDLLLHEARTIAVKLHDDGAWQLDLSFELVNVTARALTCASPAVAGRAGAGYGGLFWRGTAAMREWQVSAGEALGEVAVHGHAAAALDWTDPAGGASIRFLDQPGNPGYPARWFVRLDDYPGVCCPLAFDAPLELAAGAALRLRYALIIRDREA